VHAFKNSTDQPIRVLINAASSGFERFFAEAAEWWACSERDMSRLATIGQKYGIFLEQKRRRIKFNLVAYRIDLREPVSPVMGAVMNDAKQITKAT
jgi:hypothetical protein